MSDELCAMSSLNVATVSAVVDIRQTFQFPNMPHFAPRMKSVLGNNGNLQTQYLGNVGTSYKYITCTTMYNKHIQRKFHALGKWKY